MKVILKEFYLTAEFDTAALSNIKG